MKQTSHAGSLKGKLIRKTPTYLHVESVFGEKTFEALLLSSHSSETIAKWADRQGAQVSYGSIATWRRRLREDRGIGNPHHPQSSWQTIKD